MTFAEAIKEALDKGVSVDDLAKQFTAELNTAEKARNKSKEKETLITTTRNALRAAAADPNVVPTWAIVADAALLVVANQFPNWNAAQLKEFRSNVEKSFIYRAKLHDSTYNGNFTNCFDGMLKRFLDEMTGMSNTAKSRANDDDSRIKAWLKDNL